MGLHLSGAHALLGVYARNEHDFYPVMATFAGDVLSNTSTILELVTLEDSGVLRRLQQESHASCPLYHPPVESYPLP